MHLLSRTINLFVDFIFPKSARAKELEGLSVENMLSTLPPAAELEDESIIAIFDYSHPTVKDIVWELKYKGNENLAGKLAAILYDSIRYELADKALFESVSWRSKSILLIPIPTPDKRKAERGWNQAELIAERITSLDTEKMFQFLPKELVKIRHTESQTKTVSKSERLKNLIDSMEVSNAQTVAGRCAVVIDDVVTTGSTFNEAKRALRAAGAKNILFVAVAH